MSNNNLQHLAIIMDGNGRWAKQRFLPRSFGHKVGSDVIVGIVKECLQHQLRQLTLFAFSCENQKRSKIEVEFLGKLPKMFFDKYLDTLDQLDVRITYIGDLSFFSESCIQALENAATRTQDNQALTLCFAINYGGRQGIEQASVQYAERCLKVGSLLPFVPQEYPSAITSDVDLLLRTGNERRISNFLLYESAYAELFFCEKYWPDFTPEDLRGIIQDFHQRQRRFGTSE